MNRALEFLNEAYNLLGYPGNGDRARLLVRLAAGEVSELLEQARPVVAVLPERRAVLRERPRAALGNTRAITRG